MRKKRYIPLEHAEQVMFIKWLKMKQIFFYSIPNSSSLSSLNRNTAIKVGTVLKAEGLIKGASDVVVMLKDVCLYIEMKRAKKSLSVESEEQKRFIAKVNEFPYAKGYFAYGFSEARKIVEDHLKEK